MRVLHMIVFVHIHSVVAYNSIAFGKSTSQRIYLQHPTPKLGEKHTNTAYNMLYIAWMVILGGHNIRKISFANFDS